MCSAQWHVSQSRAHPLSTVPQLSPGHTMRLSLQVPVIAPLFYVLLSVAFPDLTSSTAGPDMMVQLPEIKADDSLDITPVTHSLSIAANASQVIEKNITIDTSVRLKLECKLSSNSKKISNVTWTHGEEQLRSDLYTYNNTDNQYTSYEFVVTDVNQTGSYSCIFNPFTDVNGTFKIRVPGVHVVSKSLISYNGDTVVLKCDSSLHKPLDWIWYKLSENELVPLNVSLKSKKYKLDTEKANETKLEVEDLSEGDRGDYVCKAVYKTGESEGRIHLNVLSYMVPLKVFLAIAAEVALLVAVILLYEMLSKRKQSKDADDGKDTEEMEQMAQLKSEDSSGAETNSTRQRK